VLSFSGFIAPGGIQVLGKIPRAWRQFCRGLRRPFVALISPPENQELAIKKHCVRLRKMLAFWRLRVVGVRSNT
jgi:hypothetical protein